MNLLECANFSVSKTDAEPNKVKIVVEPLERGYGITLGNALRRVLISSIPGSAICGFSIAGVGHEYDTVSGVKEDIMDIILNIKFIILKLNPHVSKKIIKANIQGPCIFKAGMIQNDQDFEIITKDQVICTITSNINLQIEFYCSTGKGYVTSEVNRDKSWSSNIIALDSIYSPIVNVSYDVHDTRVWDSVGSEKLTMEVKTNGVIDPIDSINIAAKILSDNFSLFKDIDKNKSNLETDKISEGSAKTSKSQVNPVLFKRINDININIRAKNCLKAENIVYVGDLVTKSLEDLRKIQNFGERSLKEVIKWLDAEDLELGMTVENWSPDTTPSIQSKFDKSIL